MYVVLHDNASKTYFGQVRLTKPMYFCVNDDLQYKNATSTELALGRYYEFLNDFFPKRSEFEKQAC